MKNQLTSIFRSAFTQLPWWKRMLMRTGIGFAGVGAVGQGLATFSDVTAGGAGTWSFGLLTSGVGCLFGFFVGAVLRNYLRLGLIAVTVLALALFGLSFVGWIDLPWGSLSELTGALKDELAAQTATMRDALTGLLPSSTMGGLGVFAGATQKPRRDEPRREDPGA